MRAIYCQCIFFGSRDKRTGVEEPTLKLKKIPLGHSLMLFWLYEFSCLIRQEWKPATELLKAILKSSASVLYLRPFISLFLLLLTKFNEIRRLWGHCRFEFELTVRRQRITELSISILCELFGTNGVWLSVKFRISWKFNLWNACFIDLEMKSS